MTEVTCAACGERNPADAEFCSACRSYLAWEVPPDADRTQVVERPGSQGPTPGEERDRGGWPQGNGEVVGPPRIIPSPRAADSVPGTMLPPMDAVALKVAVDPVEVTIAPGMAPVRATVTIRNQSPIVDGYIAELAGPPTWLRAEPVEVRLLPDTAENVVLDLSIPDDAVVLAQQARLAIGVRSLTHQHVRTTVPIVVTVPAVDGALSIKVEPSLIRMRDARSAHGRVAVTLAGANRPAQLALTGTDPELALRFAFDPPVVQVPVGGVGTAVMWLEAPPGEPGREVTRAFTVSVGDEARHAEAMGTVVQATSEVVLPPPVLPPEPAAEQAMPEPVVEREPVDWRPILRVVLTCLGAALMVAGVFQQWIDEATLTGAEWTAAAFVTAVELNIQVDAQFSSLLSSFVSSAGLVVLVFAGLALYGLAGSTGRLTRVAALLCTVFVVAFLLAFAVRVDAGSPALGTILVFAGCVSAFVGSLFARRS